MLFCLSDVYWAIRIRSNRISNRLKDKLRYLKLVMMSLFYNSFLDVYYVGDTMMEPIFWFVDHFTRFFGPIFVIGVCSLMASIVVIVYLVGIPYWWHNNRVAFVVLFTIGHWLLVNVCFHYYMAARTPPGYPPESSLIPEVVSICKKCIAPKPPRTHHCSICNRCILKMDHHCPWLNNCIGHYNHRYFFLYCVYMVLGAIFIICFGLSILIDHYSKYQTEGHGNNAAANMSIKCETPSCNEEFSKLLVILGKMDLLRQDPALPWQYESWYHGIMLYAGLMCLGVVIALGSLTVWHSKLIGRGETSIEAHINKAETIKFKKEGRVYVNPYNFGKRNNWRLFLGLHHGRSWRHVLLPSAHPPLGNGLRWQTVHSLSSNTCY